MLLTSRFGMMDYGWGLGGIIIGILFIIALIALIVLLVRASFRIGRTRQTGESPVDILKRRYAKGEISKTDFESMKKDISE